jgi:two-component system NtrC family sensor kinase
LLESVPDSLVRCLDGMSRIGTIVRSMKEFAHTDEREQGPADINRAIDATLVIARNEYKYVADVKTDLGELPPVVCHLGDLNQVFLNLVVNAAHAISDVVKVTGTKGAVHVSSRSEGEWVRIDIADSGTGIPETLRERIFEPFFTTKPVGKGTGQGLAIARTIVVDRHGGSLTFESTTGKGTTFTIRLPIAGKPRAREEGAA